MSHSAFPALIAIIIVSALAGIVYLIFADTDLPPFSIQGNATSTPVLLYYYNPEKDKDAQGNVLCSEEGLESVERSVPRSENTIEATMELLLRGELTGNERAEGLTTEYPLPGFELESSDLANGVLTLRFEDPQSKTSGGSCRVGVLRSQIEKTALQFPEVQEVRFEPEELFQP